MGRKRSEQKRARKQAQQNSTGQKIGRVRGGQKSARKKKRKQGPSTNEASLTL